MNLFLRLPRGAISLLAASLVLLSVASWGESQTGNGGSGGSGSRGRSSGSGGGSRSGGSGGGRGSRTGGVGQSAKKRQPSQRPQSQRTAPAVRPTPSAAMRPTTAPLAMPLPKATPIPEGAAITVVKVLDGGSLRVTNGARIELLGTKIPDLTAPHGEEARRFLAKLVEGQAVVLHFDAARDDGGGHTLAYVELADGTSLNEQIITAGYAEASSRFGASRADKYLQREAEAKAAGRGIWAKAAAATPTPKPTATPYTGFRVFGK